MTRAESHNEFAELSLAELMEVVISSSSYAQQAHRAHANITVLSAAQIERRGYRNLVDLLEDIPGFDFATYGDGGGEYPAHAAHRGIGGDPGSAKLLIMVDGVVQNHIAFNWSTGWTDEQMLHDLERVEIIQGPGSVLYGANAFSGVVHLISRKAFQGATVRVDAGLNNTRNLELFAGKKVGEVQLQFALRRALSDRDGDDRVDPAGYFHGNFRPQLLTENYDDEGRYLTDTPNPGADEPLPGGFRADKEDLALRLLLATRQLELGAYYWDRQDGLGSYVSGFEYDLTDPYAARVHHRGFHLRGRHHWKPSDRVSLYSTLIYRRYQQLPETAFAYTFRFPDYLKSYQSDSRQVSLEHRLDIRRGGGEHWVAGLRMQRSWKQPQQAYLIERHVGEDGSRLRTCWSRRDEGLGIPCVEEETRVDELAGYLLWDGALTERLTHSIGVRHDRSDEFGSVWTPRLGLTYQLSDTWGMKLLYGEAFRQPSSFELTDEFRGNTELVPERIGTWELQSTLRFRGGLLMKANLFHSRMSELIVLTEDPTSEGGERYVNRSGEVTSSGFSLSVEYRPVEGLSLFGNYAYTALQGELSWGAPHKLNLGVNWRPLGDRLNINLRANLVGRRLTPQSNALFRGSDAPGYAKFDLAVTSHRLMGIDNLELRLLVDNLLDQRFYGVGRQGGSSDIQLWDSSTQPNPIGFIPPYHPQPGREITLGVRYRFD